MDRKSEDVVSLDKINCTKGSFVSTCKSSLLEIRESVSSEERAMGLALAIGDRKSDLLRFGPSDVDKSPQFFIRSLSQQNLTPPEHNETASQHPSSFLCPHSSITAICPIHRAWAEGLLCFYGSP